LMEEREVLRTEGKKENNVMDEKKLDENSE
jgi:hypothetical protein